MAQNPQHTLNVLYAKILRSLQKIPQDAAYRRYTEQVIKERAAAVTEVTLVYIYWSPKHHFMSFETIAGDRHQ